MRVSSLPVLTLLFVSVAFSFQSSNNQTRAVVDFKSFDLLGDQTGWAATNKELFWTNDNGNSWKDIAPPEGRDGGIVNAFFVDASHGWVLLLAPSSPNEDPDFLLSITRDGGNSWVTNKFPLRREGTDAYAAGATMFFLDAEHGWINFKMAGNVQFSPGALMQTSDGGQSWRKVESPGYFGEILFTSLNDGWFAGGPGDLFLYRTQNGGKSWERISLREPKKEKTAFDPLYVLPVFKDAKRGYLKVTYPGPDTTTLVLFRTVDGGKSWAPAKVVPNVGQSGIPAVAAMIDSELITATAYHQGGKVRIIKTATEAGAPQQSFSARGLSDSIVWDMRFASKTQGWMLTGSGLWRTNDAGISWQNINPQSS
jgi:photosystem II stability/assembly factor-like uncharacterized protein